MIKYGMLAAGLAIASLIIWPALSGLFENKPNEATRLVEATERTNDKAENLNDSFTEVIPPAPPSQPLPPGSGLAPDPGMGQPAAGGATGQGTGPGQPQPSPTPDKYAHPSEHACATPWST